MTGMKFGKLNEKTRILIMAPLLGICVFLTLYFHIELEVGVVFSHFFYVPIIIAALWWKDKGLVVAVFLAALLIFSHIFLREEVTTAYDFFRAAMFIVVGIVIATMSKHIANTEEELRKHRNHLEKLVKGRTQTLRESEEKYRVMFETAKDAVFLSDETGKFVDVNQVACESLGYSKEELLKLSNREIDADPRGYEAFLKIRNGAEEQTKFEVDQRRKDGTLLPVEITGCFFASGGQRIALALARDITERKRAEEELHKVNRALRLLSECNQTVIKTTDESTLLDRICRLIIEVGGYRLAWIGFAEQNKEKSVCPVAQAGFEDGYPGLVNITWADTERGRGPTGTAIRNGEPFLARDIMGDANFAPWREEAAKRGYASSIALPLIAGGQTLGALNIYAVEPDAFDVEEVKLLMELADDLSYGVNTLHIGKERRRAEEALLESEKRFRQIVENALEWIWEVDANGLYTYASPIVKKILGYEPEEMVGKKYFYDLFPPEDREEMKNAAFEAFAKKLSFREFSNRNVHKTGKEIWISTSGVPILDENGELLGYRGADTDITERKRAEEALEGHIDQLERFNKVTVGREIRMKEMKEEVNSLLKELGREPGYPSTPDQEKEE